MKFNVETYLIDEEGQLNELEQECKDNIDTLKKAGFDNLVEKLEDNEDKNTIPFKLLTKKESRILICYFHSYFKPSEFEKPIPLKIASLIALCNEKNYFKELVIRSDISNGNILLSSYIVIGRDSDSNEYLVARWSVSPLKSFEELKKLVIPIVKSKIETKIRERLNEATIDLENIDNYVKKYIEGVYISYYI